MRLAISALHWIVDINKAMLKTKSIGQMLAERLHAVAFGGMMPGRQIGNARLARQMRSGLADFAAPVHHATRRIERFASPSASGARPSASFTCAEKAASVTGSGKVPIHPSS